MPSMAPGWRRSGTASIGTCIRRTPPFWGTGLIASGIGDEGRVEALEAKDRAFAVGVASHPEFKSRPDDAHPLYTAFIAAALGN